MRIRHKGTYIFGLLQILRILLRWMEESVLRINANSSDFLGVLLRGYGLFYIYAVGLYIAILVQPKVYPYLRIRLNNIPEYT